MKMDIIDKCDEFLSDEKVNFTQLIRCFNFWSRLSSEERKELVEAYQDGAFEGHGWF